MPTYTAPPPPQDKTTAEKWPEPEPLPPLTPGVAPFDAEALPAAFRPWALDVARRIQCPVEFAAAPAMICGAAALGRALAIRPRRRGDWQEHPNLWGCAIGRPSARKSPPSDAMLEPLEAIEGERREAWKSIHAEWKKEFAAFENLRDAHRANERKNASAAVRRGDTFDATDAPEPPEEPPEPRLIVGDCTAEKLVCIAADNPRGLLLKRDELAGWFASLTKSGAEGYRQFYLQTYAGKTRQPTDRIARGTLHAPPLALTLWGTVQPQPFGKLSAPDTLDDGLCERFALAVYPDAPTSFEAIDAAPDEPARALYESAIRRMAEINTPEGPEAGELCERTGTHFLRFTDEAAARFAEWETALMNRLRGDSLPPKLESHLAKYGKLVSACALICHCADAPDAAQPVSAEALARALRWAELLESHARRIYAPALRPEVEAAHRIAARLRAEDLGTPFTARELKRKHWQGLDDSDTVDEGLALLIDRGWLRLDAKDTGGRPTEEFTANPEIHNGEGTDADAD